MKPKTRTLTTHIWIYLAIFLLIILILLWLLQVLFLNSYYELRTKYLTNQLATITKKYYNEEKDSSYFDLLAYNNNACIQIIENDVMTYVSNQRRGCLFEYKEDLINSYKLDFINSNKEKKTYIITNPVLNNKTLMTGIKITDNAYAYINVSLEPTDPAISIIREELIYITIGVLISSFILAYFISKKVSSPILKINERAKEMAKGDLITPFKVEDDILEINELVETLETTKEELSRVDTTRKDLLANVSHDLKTPLTMIKAYAETARDLNKNNPKKREENLNIIIEETDRLTLLVNDILELSKSESNMTTLNKTDFNLTKTIKEIIKRFDYLKTNYGYSLEFKTKKDYIINADKQKIEEVIYNLISNAVNYTGKDKKVIIDIEENKKYIRVNIKDTGKGIDKDEIDKIWEKYYKSDNHKRNKVGTGLGLSIVKNILISHNFNYGVTSTKGKGSTFYFDINI